MGRGRGRCSATPAVYHYRAGPSDVQRARPQPTDADRVPDQNRPGRRGTLLEGPSVRFIATAVGGVTIIDIAPQLDSRGFFSRSFCASEFVDNGLDSEVAQCNISFNLKAGTIRGLHLQVP